MSSSLKSILPTYIKYFFIIANVVLTAFVIISLNFIIAPLLAAMLIAILLKPLAVKFEKLGVPRLLSSAICIISFVLLICLFISFITTQLTFIAAEPFLTNDPLDKLIAPIQIWFSKWFGFSFKKFSTESINNFLKSIVPYFSQAITVTASYIATFVLFITSLFFFIYYSNFFMRFIYKLFKEDRHAHLKITLKKIENAVKDYIVGLFIVVVVISLLNTFGLFLLGIKYALFFGILGSILTIIPYFGILIGSLIPAVYALLTTSSLWYPVGVIVVFSFVQFLEGNFITPIIIGRKENINPFIAILGLFIAPLLFGIIGLVLAIPLLGITKIICDDFKHLKPIGYVMGNPRRKSLLNTLIDKLFKKDDS